MDLTKDVDLTKAAEAAFNKWSELWIRPIINLPREIKWAELPNRAQESWRQIAKAAIEADDHKCTLFHESD